MIGNFACRKTLRSSVGYGLTLSDNKGATFHPKVMKKAILEIIGNFSENAFMFNPSKISCSANIRGFSVFLISYIMKTTCQMKCVEKVHLRKFYG